MRKIILAAAAAAALIVATAPSFAGFGSGDQPGHQYGEPGVANFAVLPGYRR